MNRKQRLLSCDFPGTKWRCKRRFKRFKPCSNEPLNQSSHPPKIKLKQAMKIKAAEFQLKLGHFDEALRELKSLPEEIQKQPWALRIRLAAVRAAREAAVGT
jgi:truncated hemoglobin YjbI